MVVWWFSTIFIPKVILLRSYKPPNNPEGLTARTTGPKPHTITRNPPPRPQTTIKRKIEEKMTRLTQGRYIAYVTHLAKNHDEYGIEKGSTHGGDYKTVSWRLFFPIRTVLYVEKRSVRYYWHHDCKHNTNLQQMKFKAFINLCQFNA